MLTHVAEEDPEEDRPHRDNDVSPRVLRLGRRTEY